MVIAKPMPSLAVQEIGNSGYWDIELCVKTRGHYVN